MIIKFSKPRGQRLKKHFMGLTHESTTPREYLWWSSDLGTWLTLAERDQLGCGCNVGTTKPTYSLKSAIRHLRTHNAYLPKGTTFRLVSRYVGHDILITI